MLSGLERCSLTPAFQHMLGLGWDICPAVNQAPFACFSATHTPYTDQVYWLYITSIHAQFINHNAIKPLLGYHLPDYSWRSCAPQALGRLNSNTRATVNAGIVISILFLKTTFSKESMGKVFFVPVSLITSNAFECRRFRWQRAVPCRFHTLL